MARRRPAADPDPQPHRPAVSAALALRAAVHARLMADAELGALLGGAKVFDEVPGSAREPYIVLSGIESRANGTASEAGEEHRLVLDIWSRQGGLAESLTTAARIVGLLDDAALTLDGHHLANLRWIATDARRAPDGLHRYASLRFRAVTEPAA